MNELLALAEEHMGASTPHSNRMACWLARAAMERAIDDLLAAKRLPPEECGSTRSKLTCLEVAYEATPLPAKAQYAWSRLSEACHQHAYELSPTYSEAEHLIALVRSVSDHVTQ